ncbi:MAG: 16S rRNA (cytosine(1402)-N(4))-methyltransferase RsmH [Candidatus Omnitrophica bacterium]|nr:16S rRNA (cytosine(1402)-N(4))-methyltransferase RsmH [Candidatus Omnitrophota bacterium]
MGERFLHRPALLEEVIELLDPAPGKIIVDATIGGGGHAEEILRRISPGGLLVGIDRDKESLEIAHQRLRSLEGQFKLINKNFRNLREIILDLEIRGIDGILFDLGISSIQMETKERGFSIKNTGPLDMRMDRNQYLTAKVLVDTLTEEELSCLIRDFGEERFHRRVARGIVEARKRSQIQTTDELAIVISKNIPYSSRRRKIHPATRTFQALRIKVNDELSALEEVLNETPELLKKGGRLCVISFHSLEDRIAKNVLKEFRAKGVFDILTKKPLRAKDEEVSGNPRVRSAKLRAAIKKQD